MGCKWWSCNIGVHLSYENKDEIRRLIAEQVSKFNSVDDSQSYTISFENIYVQDKVVEDLYLVVLRVYTIPSLLYYSTSNNEVYIKTDGGKTPLTVAEVQKRLLLRMK